MKEDKIFLKDGEPYCFSNQDSTIAVICLHGFCATPFEVKPVARALHDAGFHVVSPAITGHSIHPEDEGIKILASLTFNDWIYGVKKMVNDLKNESFEKIFVYGQSMGGAIALALAEENLVDAVAVTGPAIKLGWLADIFVPFMKNSKKCIPRKQDNTAPRNVAYSKRPAKSVYQLLYLGKYVIKNLEKIKCPVLICHSKKDKSVPASAVKILKNKIKNENVLVKWFNDSSHVYPLDSEAPKIIKVIVEFFNNLV
ncbi:MAG: alpha/beta hydrolase [Promethearchaeota archaeon]